MTIVSLTLVEVFPPVHMSVVLFQCYWLPLQCAVSQKIIQYLQGLYVYNDVVGALLTYVVNISIK